MAPGKPTEQHLGEQHQSLALAAPDSAQCSSNDPPEDPGHRLVVPIQSRVNGADVAPLLHSANASEVESWQPGLKAHQNCEKPGTSSITLAERMDQNQLGMDDGQRPRLVVPPEQDIGFDLSKEFAAAQALHGQRSAQQGTSAC